MDEELEQRLQEAQTVGVGFTIPADVAPKCSKTSMKEFDERRSCSCRVVV
jgi:hypothetical protein